MMSGPIYIQPSGEIFVDTTHTEYTAVRELLMQIGSLTKRQEPLHVYQITPLTLWHAAAAGWTPRGVLTFLRQYVHDPIPLTVQQSIVNEMSKWGQCKLLSYDDDYFELVVPEGLQEMIRKHPDLKRLGLMRKQRRFLFRKQVRGLVRQTLAHAGIPVDDRAGHEQGASLELEWTGRYTLRPYQRAAVDAFFSDRFDASGIVLLPCGAGKTLIGLAALVQSRCHTLIVTSSDASARQWIRACLEATTLQSSEIGLYRTNAPPGPVTVTTYQKVSGRTRAGLHRTLEQLAAHPWGLVIYDEVHMLPAPLFRLAAELHSVRRLGLTATLIREDGAETDVYGLVGPKCYEAGWRELEQAGYLASVRCLEIRVPLAEELAAEYQAASARDRYRIAGENPEKLNVIRSLLRRHSSDPTLIMGQYLDGLTQIAEAFGIHLITGQMPQARREQLFDAFRRGEIRQLVLSRVANTAVDLPEAAVGIQVSGLYGSRQEEAQRLGRLLRPKKDHAYFYTLVSADTVEIHTAQRRQLFLVEQGYDYELCFQDKDENRERVSAHATIGVPEQR